MFDVEDYTISINLNYYNIFPENFELYTDVINKDNIDNNIYSFHYLDN